MNKEYFSNLNYTLGNEDPSVELAVLPEGVGHVLAIAGSGSRVLPLFAKSPSAVTCVDTSIEQLYLAELRIESAASLAYKDFLSFWGYPGDAMSAEDRENAFLALDLSYDARLYLNTLFKNNNWKPILYSGRWEQTFKKLNKINRKIVGQKGVGIFNCDNTQEQNEYLNTRFPHKAWSLSLSLLGNATLFNALLYKGNFPKRNMDQSLKRFYTDSFQKLFNTGLARENFFLQLVFLGELKFASGLPLECNENIFEKAREGIRKANIRYIKGDIINISQAIDPKIDFVSLSDTPSYFSSPEEQNFLQKLHGNLSSGARVASRYYLRVPEKVNTGGFTEITDEFKEEIEKEKVQMYKFGVYRKK